MNLIKISFWNAFAVGIRILTSLGLTKILAMSVGVSGFGIIGQLQSFITIVKTLASGAIDKGVVKYTAEYNDDFPQQKKIWRTAGSICIIGSFLISFLLILFRKLISDLIFNDTSFSGILIWLAFTLLMFTLNVFLMSILNGLKEIKLYIISSIFGNIFSLAVTAILSLKFGLYGALVALTINQSIILFVTITLCIRLKWFKLKNLFGSIDKIVTKKIFGFALIGIISAIINPSIQIFLRNYIGELFGWDSVGNWHAINRISKLYLMFVTTPLSVYFLPRLSEIKEKSELLKELFDGYKIIMPVIILSSFLIFFLKDWIIITLFSEDFQGMGKLFFWQLFGDIIKIGSWLLSYVMLSKALVKLTIFTEIFFGISSVIFIIFFTSIYGVVGVQIGLAINYAISWAFIYFSLRKINIL